MDRFGRENNYWLGKKLSPEHREKIRLARIGKNIMLIKSMLKKLFLIILILSLPSYILAGGNRWGSKPPLGSVVDWSHPLAKGLVACFLMNEGGGLKVNDIARKNNGTITNGALWKPAKDGIGLDFDGTDDYVNCGSTMNFTSDQTIVAWIWLDSTNRGGILDKLESSGSYNGFTFLVGGAAFPEKLNYYNNNTDWINGNTLLSINQWYHVAVTVDADVGVSFYLNGVNDRTIVDITSAVTSNAVNVKIGADYYAIPFYLNGKINEVAVWNRALSSSEIQQLYQDPYCFIKPPTIWSMFSTAVAAARRRIGLVQ